MPDEHRKDTLETRGSILVENTDGHAADINLNDIVAIEYRNLCTWNISIRGRTKPLVVLEPEARRLMRLCHRDPSLSGSGFGPPSDRARRLARTVIQGTTRLWFVVFVGLVTLHAWGTDLSADGILSVLAPVWGLVMLAFGLCHVHRVARTETHPRGGIPTLT